MQQEQTLIMSLNQQLRKQMCLYQLLIPIALMLHPIALYVNNASILNAYFEYLDIPQYHLFAPMYYYNNLQDKPKKQRVDSDTDSMDLNIEDLLEEIATENVWVYKIYTSIVFDF